MRVAVTGAAGFIGRALCPAMTAAGHAVVACGRGRDAAVQLRDITDEAALAVAFAGCEAVVHLAARTHVMVETAADPLAAYRAVNVDGTRAVAEAAARAGVRRILFMSSIKVNGERTTERPFSADDEPKPEDAYGITKLEAERTLCERAAAGGIETVILRPPLVYGPGVGGNFARLLKICDSPWPSPFGAITGNRRSLIYVGNLANAVVTALGHPAAAGRVFLVRDGEDLSTAALIARLRRALGRDEHQWRIPQALLRVLMPPGSVDRLFGSLTVDDALIRRDLRWRPPFSVDSGLAATAAARRR